MSINLSLLFLTALCFKLATCSYDNVRLVNNGYEGIVIAINPNVSEDPKIIKSLKVYFNTHHLKHLLAL